MRAPSMRPKCQAPAATLPLLLAAAIAAGGCAATPGRAGGDRDRVLREYRDAAAFMQAARFAEAKAPLDDALLTLGGLSGGDRSAKKARGLFHEESSKGFRGEPYERVMAYYYRGIVYWMDGEPDNARACFRSAQFQDADAEEGKYQSDYAVLDYLDGYVTAKLGGDASDSLRRARSFARLGPIPDYDPKANVLVFFEMGHGPTKFAGGEYGEQLHIRPGSSAATALNLRVAGQSARFLPADDLSYQATTRGGRAMDFVLANKAVFKGTTDSFGNAAIVSGAVLAGAGGGRHSVADEVGAGLLVAGLLSKIVSAATTPAADTRAWDNLPNLIGFATLRVPPGEQTLTADFVDASGRTVLSRNVTFTVAPGARDTVLFLTDRR
ncbi:MAG: hypothetical protein DVB31_14515 [Verrucomicrobia bacterium]|nr:MAG: hypothetical protein DVB31_14515 [Verrucomicrobiota bacterium]